MTEKHVQAGHPMHNLHLSF